MNLSILIVTALMLTGSATHKPKRPHPRPHPQGRTALHAAPHMAEQLAAGANLDAHGNQIVVGSSSAADTPVAVALVPPTRIPILTNSTITSTPGTCYGTGGPALVGRTYVKVCNESGNSGSPVLWFTWDGTTPSSSSPNGKSLAVGFCEELSPLPATSVLTCVSTASDFITIKEQ